MASRFEQQLRSWYNWRGGYPVAVLLAHLLWPRATAGVLLVRNDRLLAVNMGSYLMLPVGGLEYDESFADAARREAREEAGVNVELGDRVYEGKNAYGGVEVLFEGHVVDADDDVDLPDPVPTSRSVWVPLHEVPSRRWRFHRNVDRLLDEVGITDDRD